MTGIKDHIPKLARTKEELAGGTLQPWQMVSRVRITLLSNDD